MGPARAEPPSRANGAPAAGRGLLAAWEPGLARPCCGPAAAPGRVDPPCGGRALAIRRRVSMRARGSPRSHRDGLSGLHAACERAWRCKPPSQGLVRGGGAVGRCSWCLPRNHKHQRISKIKKLKRADCSVLSGLAKQRGSRLNHQALLEEPPHDTGFSRWVRICSGRRGGVAA